MELYIKAEKLFERLAHFVLKIFSSPVTFILALALVTYWIFARDFSKEVLSDFLRDIILAITFLSFFIIQKTFSHFSTVLNLKLNELIASHEQASNKIVKVEDKMEEDLEKLGQKHEKLAGTDDPLTQDKNSEK